MLKDSDIKDDPHPKYARMTTGRRAWLMALKVRPRPEGARPDYIQESCRQLGWSEWVLVRNDEFKSYKELRAQYETTEEAMRQGWRNETHQRLTTAGAIELEHWDWRDSKPNKKRSAPDYAAMADPDPDPNPESDPEPAATETAPTVETGWLDLVEDHEPGTVDAVAYRPLPMGGVRLAEMTRAAERELDRRRYSYPLLVQRGKMTQDWANREIRLMADIMTFLRAALTAP